MTITPANRIARMVAPSHGGLGLGFFFGGGWYRTRFDFDLGMAASHIIAACPVASPARHDRLPATVPAGQRRPRGRLLAGPGGDRRRSVVRPVLLPGRLLQPVGSVSVSL